MSICKKHKWNEDGLDCQFCYKENEIEDLQHDIEVLEEELIACLKPLEDENLLKECNLFFRKVYNHKLFDEWERI